MSCPTINKTSSGSGSCSLGTHHGTVLHSIDSMYPQTCTVGRFTDKTMIVCMPCQSPNWDQYMPGPNTSKRCLHLWQKMASYPLFWNHWGSLSWVLWWQCFSIRNCKSWWNLTILACMWVLSMWKSSVYKYMYKKSKEIYNKTFSLY